MNNQDNSRQDLRKAGQKLKNAANQVGDSNFNGAWESFKDAVEEVGSAMGITEENRNNQTHTPQQNQNLSNQHPQNNQQRNNNQ
ncbi:MAG TPA: hypothetical protein DDY49_15245 [Paenibacillaceae bacterium]|nr:hypothetical protein [Paenibacillaceae bacterium]